MICLLSPAKTLMETSASLASTFRKSDVALKSKVSCSKPTLEKQSRRLVESMQQLNKKQLKDLLGVSDAIADLNFNRFKDFYNQKEYIASYLYDGPAYKGLNAMEMNDEELKTLEKSLCILTGLYGYVKAFDVIQPYRLDMGKKLQADGCKNLYDYWKTQNITKSIGLFAKQNGAKIVLNCASQEYAKVVDFAMLENDFDIKVVNCVFKANSGRLASVFAKQARGMMVRYVATTNPSTLDDLQGFSGSAGHFRYSGVESNGTDIVFERFETPITKRAGNYIQNQKRKVVNGGGGETTQFKGKRKRRETQVLKNKCQRKSALIGEEPEEVHE
eukprot:CAMPEP_0204835290 /NCGR_PEP_ID=MMETSP1346-20131115/22184_1 /ASSEMBLY_ACC=CAM_ASM_000771 /TAXON_ID=215587 /ORGANISM="Aplanochytrium stocchinoi, Strain GSBS06" /LENGTH=330 /DNA_ID=CAMNT_0051969161 /DNA_START=211 /DNA_END=1207 /DNA_ORIENTATION=-